MAGNNKQHEQRCLKRPVCHFEEWNSMVSPFWMAGAGATEGLLAREHVSIKSVEHHSPSRVRGSHRVKNIGLPLHVTYT